MSPAPPAPAWLLIEGGGSHTWVSSARGETILTTAEGPSTNPRSVGEDRAAHTLIDLMDRACTSAEAAPMGVIAAHGAASTRRAAEDFAALIRRALANSGVRPVPLLVTNDLTPLLLSARGPVCVVNCGTGTGFAARNGDRWARVSGLEWLLSDEGGGHDLAVRGLRAVIRALDGRGPDTALSGLARLWCADTSRTSGDLGADLFAHVYRAESTKAHVASFAQQVLEAAEDGDQVACRLVQDAASELAVGAAAACRATAISTGTKYTLVLSGSLLTEATLLRGHFLDWVHDRLPPASLATHSSASRPSDMLRLRDLWLTPDALVPLREAMPTHGDTAPTAAEAVHA